MNSSLNEQQKEYIKYIEKKSPKSSMVKDCVLAFVIGGLICIVGQLLFDLGSRFLDDKGAASFTTILMIFIGATLTGMGIYDRLGKVAGAGSIVPITGFANSIVAPAMEFKKEGLVQGVGSKMFAVAGPVLVYGIGASVVVGIIYWLAGNLFG